MKEKLHENVGSANEQNRKGLDFLKLKRNLKM